MSLKWVDGAQDGPDLAQAPVKRSKLEDRSMTTTQNSKASFLGLPVELRLRIYGNVLGGQLLHITTRPCKPYDKGAFRPNALLPSWGPISRAWKKWTHTVCQVPDDWRESYERSKQVRIILRNQEEDTPPDDYYTRHDLCSWIQEDFQDRKYNYPCSHRKELGHRPHFCIEQEEHAARTTESYGQPEAGLEKYHRESRLRLDVLGVCRQTYQEAVLLPYQMNIFNFDYPATLQDFVVQALTSHQSAAIQRLHIGPWPIEDLAMAARLLPALHFLQYSGGTCTGMAPEDARRVRIAKVEVIFECISDRDPARHRQEAVMLEHSLMGLT